MLTEQKLITAQGKRIAVVAGLRTPFNKKDTGFKQVFAADLGTMVAPASRYCGQALRVREAPRCHLSST